MKYASSVVGMHVKCYTSRSVHMYNLYVFVKIDSNLKIVLEIYNSLIVVRLLQCRRCKRLYKKRVQRFSETGTN